MGIMVVSLCDFRGTAADRTEPQMVGEVAMEVVKGKTCSILLE